MEMIRTYDGRVSLTYDTWTSTFGEQFMSTEEEHNGFNIKTHNFFSISLDNATANTKAMDLVKEIQLSCCLVVLLYMLDVAHCDEYDIRKKVISFDTPTRWNSTYKLLHDAIAYRDAFTDMYNKFQTTDGWFITNDHWSLAKYIHDVLETFDNATHIFSYVYEPNIHMVILECVKIICTIKQTSQANPDPSVKNLLDNMKVNGVKLEGLTHLLTFYYDQLGVSFDVPYYVNKRKIIIERLCEDYGAMIQPQPVGSSMGTSRFGILGPVLKKQRPDGLGSSSSSSSSIIVSYLSKNCKGYPCNSCFNHPLRLLLVQVEESLMKKDIVFLPKALKCVN
ncbi:putative AC transposase, partial [Bienertia sinuspersici]